MLKAVLKMNDADLYRMRSVYLRLQSEEGGSSTPRNAAIHPQVPHGQLTYSLQSAFHEKVPARGCSDAVRGGMCTGGCTKGLLLCHATLSQLGHRSSPSSTWSGQLCTYPGH
jgi:hypothetical protein